MGSRKHFLICVLHESEFNIPTMNPQWILEGNAREVLTVKKLTWEGPFDSLQPMQGVPHSIRFTSGY